MKDTLHAIDDYDIGQLLGRGGFASVYRVRERKTGMLYALKIMEKSNILKNNMELRDNSILLSF
jgi:serine/threonine protein kinase